MFKGDLKLAIKTLRSTKWRTFLTMLGIMIGVASVVITVSLGEGVKKQITGQINQLGPDLITVRAGRVVNRDSNGEIKDVNLFSVFGGSSLSEKDYEIVKKSSGVKLAVPFALINAVPRTDTTEMDSALVVASNEFVPEALNQKVEFGAYYTDAESDKDIAIIGTKVAEKLFQESVPIGKTLSIKGKTLVVRGVFENFETNPLAPNTDYNSAVFIPYSVGKALSDDNLQIYQILVRPENSINPKATIDSLNQNLTASHSGQKDFSVLKQSENLAIANSILNLLTGLIAGIAAISLVVGGIGIMNIMLVSVTERTKEIGLRKAVGGTNRQILSQFLVEAMLLSLMGGLLGVVASVIGDIFIRIFTDLKPVITFPIMGIAVGVALVVGVFFGVMPAIRAAQKDPIEALRHD